MNEKKKGAALKPIESIFGNEVVREKPDTIIEADIGDLFPFKDHPFQVRDDEEMDALVESIEQNGILTPLIVRPRMPKGFEIIAGHRRRHGGIRAGLKRVPIDIRDVDDDTAVLMMVNTNVQREKVLPSEKAYAYKMMLDAIKRQGARNDLTSSQSGTKLRADKVVADSVGQSRNQLQRFIRLTHLVDALLMLIDTGKLPFNAGVELSYLRTCEQDDVFNIMNEHQIKPTISQAVRLKEESIIREITKMDIRAILLVEKPSNQRIRFASDVFSKYFDGYTQHEAEKVILTLLDEWKRNAYLA